MHAFPIQNVNRARKRCGDRRNKDRISTIVELFNYKSRNEALFDFNERGLPDLLLTLPGQLLRETPD